MKRTIIAAAAVASAVLLAPTAHADESGYLNQLNQSGVPTPNPAGALMDGRMVCDNLRHGMTPEQVASPLKFALVAGFAKDRRRHCVPRITASHSADTDRLGSKGSKGDGRTQACNVDQ
jgi:Protein of unknown function (DUF732)